MEWTFLCGRTSIELVTFLHNLFFICFLGSVEQIVHCLMAAVT